MKYIGKKLLFAIITIPIILSCSHKNKSPSLITKGGLTYDFRYVDLAVTYLETGDSTLLYHIAELEATDHLLNHAKYFNNDVPKDTGLDLVKHLFSPSGIKKENLFSFKKNVDFAKKIAQQNLPQVECLKYLPEDFSYSSNLFFTFGYDLGVVFKNNASINLVHSHYLEHQNEIKYYAIHELHHAGFVELKENKMPSINITNYAEMADFISYYTHLEGMGTYAPLELRQKNNAMDTDKDYVALQDETLMGQYEKEYFDIYNHFHESPHEKITDKDWELISVLSNKKRLWYRVGALMAQRIDQKLGREKLVALISEPSENFIKTYLSIQGDL